MVLPVAGGAVGVVEAFEHFWTQDVVRVGDVEARTVVEFRLVGGDVGIVPGETLWSDAG